MNIDAVSDYLAKRSSDEKKTLLLELLRELVQQSPQEPISIEDDSGKLVGLFSPVAAGSDNEYFVEGSPSFFRELERRRQTKNLVSAEEAHSYLHAKSTNG